MPTIALTTRTGARPGTAYYVRHGLAVTKMLDAGNWWHVTHVASGMAMDTGFYRRQRAKAYQDALLATTIDWTQSGDALRCLPDVQQTIKRLLAKSPRD